LDEVGRGEVALGCVAKPLALARMCSWHVIARRRSEAMPEASLSFDNEASACHECTGAREGFSNVP